MFNEKESVKVGQLGEILSLDAGTLTPLLKRLEKEGYYIVSVDTDISYSGSAGYQVIGTIVYEEEYDDDSDDFKIPDTIGFVDFCPGESLPSSETTEA